jgi:flavin-dependent dehydrogenase
MRIAIIGAGVGGRALYRLLELEGGNDVEIFDIKQTTVCGISPCGWGVCTQDFRKVHEDLQLQVQTIRDTYDVLQVDGMEVPCDLCTFDKPSFLDKICHPKHVIRDPPELAEYDLIVDATGSARAILPTITADLKITCRQAKYKTSTTDKIAIFPSSSVGYAWIFPISDSMVHIGQGVMNWDPELGIPPETYKAKSQCNVYGERPECACTSEIRLLTPSYCTPIVHKNVVGVGEAAGCVSPMCGAGVILAIRSAILLADNIDDLQRYEQMLISDFSFLDREVRIVRKLEAGRRLSLIDLACLYRNCRRFGISPGLMELVKILKMIGGRLM